MKIKRSTVDVKQAFVIDYQTTKLDNTKKVMTINELENIINFG
jgi:hypothetical protein